jgi:hypothetical protein
MVGQPLGEEGLGSTAARNFATTWMNSEEDSRHQMSAYSAEEDPVKPRPDSWPTASERTHTYTHTRTGTHTSISSIEDKATILAIILHQ